MKNLIVKMMLKKVFALFSQTKLIWLALLMVGTTAHAGVTVRYQHTDTLGSVIMETNASGQMIGSRHQYQPFGQGLNGQKTGLGYTGHLEDTDLGLTYMQQRYYDPVIGRFYSNDPVGFTASNPMMFNRYAYANNNPYKYTDPDGRNPRRPKLPNEVKRDNEVAEVLGEALVDILPDGAVKDHIKKNVDTLKVLNASNRRNAMKKAQQHAQVPRKSKGGEDIKMNELNPSSRGENYNNIKKSGGTNIGRRDPNSKAEVMDHPDGHNDNNAPHHNSPHVHGVDRKGNEIIVLYPENN